MTFQSHQIDAVQRLSLIDGRTNGHPFDFGSVE